MVLGLDDPFICCIEDLECIDLYDCLKVRHFRLRKPFPDNIIHKEDLRLRMIYKMMDVGRLEFVKERYRHCTVCHNSQKSHSPVCLVARTDGHLMSFLKTAFLKHYMELLHSPCYILVVESLSVIIGDRRAVPILLESFLIKLVY